MMVASIHMTKKEGEEVKRGDEVSCRVSNESCQSLSEANPLTLHGYIGWLLCVRGFYHRRPLQA